VDRGDDATLIPLTGAGHFEVVTPGTSEGKRVIETVAALG
jgi:hypothetical protein